MHDWWVIPALVCYVASAAGFISERAGSGGRSGARRAHFAIAALGAGTALQTADLVMRGVQAGNIPVTNLAQSLIFLDWLIALAGLGMILRLRMQVIGAFVAPVAANAPMTYHPQPPGSFQTLPATLASPKISRIARDS